MKSISLVAILCILFPKTFCRRDSDGASVISIVDKATHEIEDTFCAYYNNSYRPPGQNQSVYVDYVDLMPKTGCKLEDFSLLNSTIYSSISDFWLILKGGECSVQTKINFTKQASNYRFSRLLIVELNIPRGMPKKPRLVNENFTVASIANYNYLKLKAYESDHYQISGYWLSITPGSISLSSYILGPIAFLCILCGAYLAGPYQVKQQKTQRIPVNKAFVVFQYIFLIGVLVSALLLLYYFFDYFVWFAIVNFVIFSSFSLTYCLMEIVNRLPIPEKTIPFSIKCCDIQSLDVRCLILYPFCLGFSISWVVLRHQSYAWVLQDILGFALCVCGIKYIQFPSLSGITILLIFVFLYDIFMVFITPFLMPSGKNTDYSNPNTATISTVLPNTRRKRDTNDNVSVMEAVALGVYSSTNEKVPAGFLIPDVYIYPPSSSNPCNYEYALLGYGDIALPGLLLGFLHSFDIASKTPHKLYLQVGLYGYVVGYILCIIALNFMKMAQPALLYLVPCTLIPVLFVAGFMRKATDDLRRMWTGSCFINNVPDKPSNTDGNYAILDNEESVKDWNQNSESNQSVTLQPMEKCVS